MYKLRLHFLAVFRRCCIWLFVAVVAYVTQTFNRARNRGRCLNTSFKSLAHLTFTTGLNALDLVLEKLRAVQHGLQAKFGKSLRGRDPAATQPKARRGQLFSLNKFDFCDTLQHKSYIKMSQQNKDVFVILKVQRAL